MPAVLDVAAGAGTCALTRAGRVSCWGPEPPFGQATQQPRDVGIARARAVAVGSGFACALDSLGDAWCWGDGSLFGASEGSRPMQAHRVTSNARLAQISVGFDHACAIDERGGVTCWGGNQFGQLGRNPNAHRSGDLVRITLQVPAASIAAASWATCATDVQGAAWCWGRRSDGRTSGAPERVAIGNAFRAVYPTAHGALGVTRTGALIAWAPGRSPVGIGGFEHVDRISVGTFFFCAERPAGQVRCAGDNSVGELGTGIAGAATELRVADVPLDRAADQAR